MRNWIIWHYTFGQQTNKKFAKSHTHILYFTKEKPDLGFSNVTFNARCRSRGQCPPDNLRRPPRQPQGKAAR